MSGALHSVRYFCPSCDTDFSVSVDRPRFDAEHRLARHVGESEVFGDGPCAPTAIIDGQPLAFDPKTNTLEDYGEQTMTDNDDELTLDDLPEIPDDLLCPECEDGRTVSTEQPTRFFCENCGVVMDGDPPEDYVVINDVE